MLSEEKSACRLCNVDHVGEGVGGEDALFFPLQKRSVAGGLDALKEAAACGKLGESAKGDFVFTHGLHGG